VKWKIPEKKMRVFCLNGGFVKRKCVFLDLDLWIGNASSLVTSSEKIHFSLFPVMVCFLNLKENARKLSVVPNISSITRMSNKSWL